MAQHFIDCYGQPCRCHRCLPDLYSIDSLQREYDRAKYKAEYLRSLYTRPMNLMPPSFFDMELVEKPLPLPITLLVDSLRSKEESVRTHRANLATYSKMADGYKVNAEK